MKTIKELAEELNVSYQKVQYLFHKWCKKNGRHPSEYHEIELIPARSASGFVPRKKALVPAEAERWIRMIVNRPSWPGPIGQTWSIKEKMRKKLGREIITTTDLARKYGIRADKVRREFKWWCYIHNKNPHDFYKPGVGYVLPAEFIEYMEQLVKKLGGA